MRTARYWTEEEDNYLRTNYPSKLTTEVAAALGRSAVAIKCRAAEIGVKKTRDTIARTASVRYDGLIAEINQYDIDNVPLTVAFKHEGWLRRKYEEEMLSLQDIADMTTCTRKNIEYWMRRYGIERRNNQTRYTERYLAKISDTGKGRVPFSKGLTKYDHPSIMQISLKTSREKSPHWKGGAYIDVNGYRRVRDDNHPNKDKDGYVLEHRLVLEFILGRLLLPTEVVHHRDRNRRNNLSSNLYLFPSNRAHMAFHAYQKFKDTSITEETFMERVFADEYAA